MNNTIIPNLKILVSAGGTGGHIIPAINVCEELLKNNIEIHFIGNKNSMEQNLISTLNSKVYQLKSTSYQLPAKANHPPAISYYEINVQKLYRKFTLKHILFPFKLFKSIIIAKNYIKQIKPHAFIGFGGFVSGPAAIAAWLQKCPVFIQEQNARPGITNKYLAKIAKKVFTAYPESNKFFPKNKTILTGNPIKYQKNHSNLNSKLSTLNSKLPTLLILGGSQGSKFINDLIIENLNFILEKNINIIWQTGKNHIDIINTKLSTLNSKLSIEIFDFTNNIQDYYKKADYVITRGGAMTLAEIEAYNIPAFIIPLPSAAVNEQKYNAISMKNKNKAIMFEQKDKNNFKNDFDLFINKANYMYNQNDKSIHQNATKNIVNFILDYVGTGRALSTL